MSKTQKLQINVYRITYQDSTIWAWRPRWRVIINNRSYQVKWVRS